MELARSTDIDDVEYERFLGRFGSRPGAALAYHYPFYLRFLRDIAYPGSSLRFMTARNHDGELIGVMPALHLETPQLNVWLSLAYFGPNAGALVPDADSREGTAIVGALVEAALADARERRCGSMTVYTPLGAAAEPYEAVLNGVEFRVPRVAQCLTIPDVPGESPFPRKVRYYARRAASMGMTVREIASVEELDAIWNRYRDRCERQGIPVKPLEHIRRLYRTAGARGMFLVAERDGAIHAALICFMGGGVISYYLPVVDPEAAGARPLLLLLEHAVAIGRSAGCRVLNFEGSPRVGDSVYRFKAECGGRPVPFHVFVKLLQPSALAQYRSLGAAQIHAEAPHAFIVPFDALA